MTSPMPYRGLLDLPVELTDTIFELVGAKDLMKLRVIQDSGLSTLLDVSAPRMLRRARERLGQRTAQSKVALDYQGLSIEEALRDWILRYSLDDTGLSTYSFRETYCRHNRVLDSDSLHEDWKVLIGRFVCYNLCVNLDARECRDYAFGKGFTKRVEIHAPGTLLSTVWHSPDYAHKQLAWSGIDCIAVRDLILRKGYDDEFYIRKVFDERAYPRLNPILPGSTKEQWLATLDSLIWSPLRGASVEVRNELQAQFWSAAIGPEYSGSDSSAQATLRSMMASKMRLPELQASQSFIPYSKAAGYMVNDWYQKGLKDDLLLAAVLDELEIADTFPS